MNLVKWMRKNNRQIMAVVVVLIMIGFVGGYGLQQLLSHLGGGPGGPAAYYLDNERISRQQIEAANVELKVLRSLFAAEMLRGKLTFYQSPDFKARLLGQLLFPDAQSAAMTSVEMYQAMARGRLDVSGRQIDAFFERARGQSEIYWILLRVEARRVGCVVSGAQAKLVLQRMIPQILPRAGAAQVLDSVINSYHMPEEQVLRVFGDLLGVMAYADAVTSNESVTTGELRARVGRDKEQLKAEYVQFAASDFVADQNEPAEAMLTAQFETYKDVLEGQATEANPYGFGYTLPPRVQLEYLIIKNEDVEKLIQQPTLDDMEDYYARNISEFQESVKKDPNNPDAGTIKRTKPYAEVAEQIRGMLTEERTDRLANVIINDAMELAEAGFAGLEMEKATVGDLKAAAADYVQVASKLQERHKLAVHTGTTGMLSMNDLSGNRRLGTLAIQGQSRLPVGLAKMVFAIEELGVTELGPFEAARPRRWENIGPLREGLSLAVVRVIEAAKAEAPANLDVSYSIQGPVVDAMDRNPEAVYSVREKVVADCKLLAAMETARARADAFVQLLADKTWTEAVGAYNEKYATRTEDGKPVFGQRLESDKLDGGVRMAQRNIEQIQERFGDNPMAAAYIQSLMERKQLNDDLYALLGDRTEVKDLHAVMEFKPGAAYYVVKDVSRTEVTRADYSQAKAELAFGVDATQSQSLGLVHFKPDNILKRMAFRWAQEDEGEPTPASVGTAESEEASI